MSTHPKERQEQALVSAIRTWLLYLQHGGHWHDKYHTLCKEFRLNDEAIQVATDEILAHLTEEMTCTSCKGPLEWHLGHHQTWEDPGQPDAYFCPDCGLEFLPGHTEEKA